MPLVRIDMLEGRTRSELDAIGEGVHRALVESIGIPVLDRFQVIADHPPGALLFDPEYLSIRRTRGVVFIQITISAGRSLEQKRALYAAIARNLSSGAAVRPEDVLVNLVEVSRENWSFEDREGGMILSNHSCDPNVGVAGQIVFVALRDIRPGEELTHDWAMTDDDTYERECRCGSLSCRKVVTGQDWRKPELREKYGDHMSWYLRDKWKRERAAR